MANGPVMGKAQMPCLSASGKKKELQEMLGMIGIAGHFVAGHFVAGHFVAILRDHCRDV